MVHRHLRPARLLLRNQGAIDVIGKPDAARLGEGLGVFIGKERAPHTAGATAAEWAVALDAGEHLAEHRVEEGRLEIDRAGARLVAHLVGQCSFHGRRRAGRDERLRQFRAACGCANREARHHITSISAWIAPAALIACRIEIRSRGPMPSAFNPSTSCCSETPSLTTANFLPSSDTPTRVRGATLVSPRENGCGWLTTGVSEIVTVRLPCATATV